MKTSKFVLLGLGLLALGATTSTARAGGLSFSISIGNHRPAFIHRPPVIVAPAPPVFCAPPVPVYYPPPVYCAPRPVFVAPYPIVVGPGRGHGHGHYGRPGHRGHHGSRGYAQAAFHGRGGGRH